MKFLEVEVIATLKKSFLPLTKLSNWIKHRVQVSSNPWDMQNASHKLKSYDSCMTWDICVLNSWTTQKQDIILLIDRRLARLLSVLTVLKTGFGDTFVSLYIWLSFYECSGNWLYYSNTHNTFSLFSGRRFEFRHGQSNYYF